MLVVKGDDRGTQHCPSVFRVGFPVDAGFTKGRGAAKRIAGF